MGRRIRRSLAAAAVVGGGVAAWAYLGPVPADVVHPRASASTLIVTDRDGIPLDAVSARLLAARDRDATRASAPRKGVPSLAKRAWRLSAATIAAEDQRFRSHPGIDAVAVSRAVLHDVRARGAVEGGSTLTQQLVKLRLGRAGRKGGLSEKVTEALGALRLDRSWSKDRILSTFLAEAPYGGRIVGADDAARGYFDVPVSQLTWAQAAYLAALPQRPTRFNPRRDPTAAIARQRWILRRLRADHVITAAELRSALHERLVVGDAREDAIAPHFVEMVRAGRGPAADTPGGTAGGTAVDVAGGVLRSTIDADLQRSVAGIATRQRNALKANGAANVAVVVIDNATGAIRAWEGSGDATDISNGGAINGPLQRRQTGSTIKPFIYGLAFDAGHSPADLVDDSPFVRPGFDTDFRPQNYDHRFRGPVSMREALGSSINVPAVKVLAEVGADQLVEELAKANVEIPGGVSRNGLSLALGVGEIDLLDLTRAYSSIARGGRAVDAVVREPAAAQRGGRRLLSSAAAFLVTDVLADNDARASAFGRHSLLTFPFPVAAKTGTSQNFHDNWVVGYTPQFTVGVWVGNFDRRPLRGATGITGAGPLFHDVMLAAHERLTPRWGVDREASMAASVPDELEAVSVCADAACSRTRDDYRWTDRRAPVSADVVAARPAASTSATGAVPVATPDGARPPVTVAPAKLTLLEPRPRSRYVIDPAVPLASQRLPLKASGGLGPYAFTIDGAAQQRSWALVRGVHEGCVVDGRGRRACATFEVR